MRLRTAVVGVGPAWESRHLPALRALSERFEVVAFCDPVQHRAECAARPFKAAVHDGYRGLMRREDVDVVLLLSATFYGALPIYAACDMGKAVYCAAAIDLQDAEAIALRTRVEEAGIAFMAEFPCRLSPATLRLKELLATRLGAPRLLFCNRRRIHPAKQKHDSRCYRDLVELVDWCRYVVETEPTSLLATAHSVTLPGVTLPGVTLPGVTLPGVTVPGVTVPGVTLPGVAAKKVAAKRATEHRAERHQASGQGTAGQSTKDSATNNPVGPGPASRLQASEQVRQDYFSLSLDFSPAGEIGTGPLAVISCGDYIPQSLQESLAYRRPADLKIVCEKGIAFVDLPNTVAWFDEAGQHLESLDHERPVGEQLLIHFHRAVASLILKSSSLADAHRAIMIANQAKLSCQSGSRLAC